MSAKNCNLKINKFNDNIRKLKLNKDKSHLLIEKNLAPPIHLLDLIIAWRIFRHHCHKIHIMCNYYQLEIILLSFIFN